jgi:cytochrome P450
MDCHLRKFEKWIIFPRYNLSVACHDFMFSFLQINQVHNNTFQFRNLLQVIDETLRLITFSLTVFREAKTDFSING